jgi:DUF1680 family protein
VVWGPSGGERRLTLETGYPIEESIVLTLGLKQNAGFAIKFRVPGWARDVTASVNGADAGISCPAGNWAAIVRTWSPGDRIEIRIPLRFRMQPVDVQHPDRVALVRGPVVYVLDTFAHSQNFRLPDTDAELNKWVVADTPPGAFHVELPGGGRVGSKLLPFYSMGEVAPYKMYFDRKSLPFRIW